MFFGARCSCLLMWWVGGRYVKQNISLAPNNPSAWNYLRGALDINNIPYSTVGEFVKLYTVAGEPGSSGDIVDLENPPPSRGAYLPCPLAIEFMADIQEKDGGKEPILRAIEVCCAQGNFFPVSNHNLAA